MSNLNASPEGSACLLLFFQPPLPDILMTVYCSVLYAPTENMSDIEASDALAWFESFLLYQIQGLIENSCIPNVVLKMDYSAHLFF